MIEGVPADKIQEECETTVSHSGGVDFETTRTLPPRDGFHGSTF